MQEVRRRGAECVPRKLLRAEVGGVARGCQVDAKLRMDAGAEHGRESLLKNLHVMNGKKPSKTQCSKCSRTPCSQCALADAADDAGRLQENDVVSPSSSHPPLPAVDASTVSPSLSMSQDENDNDENDVDGRPAIKPQAASSAETQEPLLSASRALDAAKASMELPVQKQSSQVLSRKRERDEVATNTEDESSAALVLGHEEKRRRIAAAVRTILTTIGEDADREGLLKTPLRFAEAMLSFTSGYSESPAQILGSAEFDEDHHELVLLRGIDIYSLCEHHLVPFYGKCCIAYIPNGKVVGLSKLAKIADTFAQRLQVQERLTSQIADAIEEEIRPKGVAVHIEAQHMCMVMRGVKKSGASTVTTAMRGVFRSERDRRAEFFSLIR
ncbi:GTP cyclohydrolase 1 [Porphyridium purpureum]|uniref:GTP cyclohydrolase 1 n=1 Tax=Porphyridium purpureum TaxID=35688 RepID=A0A5J4Z082_PORPP|nr:GTP cyclohydrolase 1 [Porphyridium purpureum]|eukprot:POR4303..scf209_3